MATFGIEEEYVFLDRATLEPREVMNEVYRELGVTRGESRHVQREFLLSQLERPTPVCATVVDAVADLRGFRQRLRDAAETVGVLAASVGTHPRALRHGTVTSKPRYRRVAEENRTLALDHFYNGLHVHVRIPDREAGVRALNRMRRWMPLIVALSVNSPFWQGSDTGFSSWRTINLQRWTTHGTPPAFVDAVDYDQRIAGLVGVGGTIDKALVAWNIRLSDNFPTIEVRAPDAQLEVWHTVLMAALVRGLVVTALAGELLHPELQPELIDSAVWHAARDGITASLLDPLSGEMVSARQAVDTLLGYIAGALAAEGDAGQVVQWVDRLFAEGTGASRQCEAFAAGGLPALAALYRETFVPA
ncbi:MAG: hypothetical protein JWP30_322 [Homoserinimonas sp.]|nr:hypothetical protein [Homoserinimonas sp.]